MEDFLQKGPEMGTFEDSSVVSLTETVEQTV